MKKNVTFKLAASTLALGLTMVGCKPAAQRPTAMSAKAATDQQGAHKLYEKAQAAAQQGNLSQALTLAEQAVERAPRDAGYRMLLADLYLKNGRFVSAEAAFTDVLALKAGDKRAGLSRVLAMIGQGKSGAAAIELDRLSTSAAPADVGLAYALAGDPQRAIEMLEPAARAPDANGRVRQNLALAYALAGDWQKARTIAAQDLSPAELGSRLEQWASFANPAAPYTQVATLLGVTPVEDPGQPVRLALAPVAPEPQAYAAVELPLPAPVEAAPAQAAPVVAQAAAPVPPFVQAPAQPVQLFAKAPPQPIRVAKAPPQPVQLYAKAPPQPVQEPIAGPAGEAFTYSAPEPVDAFSAPVAVASVRIPVETATAKVVTAESSAADVPMPLKRPRIAGERSFAAAEAVAPAPVKQKTIAGAQFAAAVQSLNTAPPRVIRTGNPVKSPIAAFAARRLQKAMQAAASGGYVVQLGAFRSAAQVEKAWAQAQRRYGFRGVEPLSTTVTIPGQGTFHRLAVAGFDDAGDANRVCSSIKAKQGACFVRTTAGDAPVQWASRYTDRRG